MSDADDEEAKRWARFRKWRESEQELQAVTGIIDKILSDMPRRWRETKLLNARFEEVKAQITANISGAGWLESWSVAMSYRHEAEMRLLAWYRRAYGEISKGHNYADFPPPPAPPNMAVAKRRAEQERHRALTRRIQELQAKRSLSDKESKELARLQKSITGLARRKQAERRAK